MNILAAKKEKHPISLLSALPFFCQQTALTIIVIGILTSKYAYLNIVYFGLAYI
jgi:hypothetical protein